MANQEISRNRRGTMAGAGLVLAMLASPGVLAATIPVNTQNMGIVFDSQCGLREAIQAVNSGQPFAGCPSPDGNADRITVPAGTYSTQTHLDIFRPVTIAGSGQGQTFIETGADYGFGVFTGNSQVPVILGLERLTLRKTSQAQPQAKGIYAVSGNLDTAGLRLDHVRVTGYTGDAIRIDSPNENDPVVPPTAFLHARNCLIDNNAFAGIQSVGATNLVLEYCRIAKNSFSGMKLVNGPAARLWYCTVDSNSTPISGGGIYSYLDESLPNVSQFSHLELNFTTVSHNYAAGDGGGIYFGGHSFDANHSTFSGNRAAGSGGGIYDAFRTDYSNHEYITVAFNDAGSQGGGVYQTDVGTGTPEVMGSVFARNSIAGNFAPSDAGTDYFTEFKIRGRRSVFGTRNGWTAECDDFGDCDQLIRPASGGILDPLLGPLDYHGGPSRVHPLLPGSPAIDLTHAIWGPNCDFDDFGTCVTEDLRDQRGFGRPGNGNPTPGNPDWDAGAFELQCEGGAIEGPGCEDAAETTRPMIGKLIVTTQWQTGYCAEVHIENPNSVPTTDWLANFNLNDGEIFDIWNLNASGNTGAVTLTPTAAWNRVIPAGGSTHSLGFCANLGVLNTIGGAVLYPTLPGIAIHSGIGVRAEFPGEEFDDRVFQLAFLHSSLCLDAFGTLPGSDVGQWACHGGANQKWRFNHRGLGYFELVDTRDNLCLEVAGGSTANGAAIRVNTCNGTTAQQFIPVQTGPGTYQLKNRNSGKLVDVEGASTANGTKVIQWPDNGGGNQKMIFTE